MRSLISVDEATHAIHAHPGTRSVESVPLAESVGRILAREVRAERAHPPFDRVTMDGIATRWEPVMPSVLRVVGAQTAGHEGQVLTEPGTCIEVSAGAVLPEGCDCVIPIEQLVRTRQGYALVDTACPMSGQFIHRKGSDCPAEATVLEVGVRINSPQIALLAANGVATVEVARIPNVAIIATGDEQLDVDAPLQPGRIRRSNDVTLMASLRAAGLDHPSIHHLPEDPDILGSSLSRVLQDHDVLVVSGGVTMGQRDYLPTTLESVGVRCIFHGIAQRPGRPMWFGLGPAGQRVFALPGNAVSSLICLVRYVRPALLAAMGLTAAGCEQVRLVSAVPANSLAQFIPVRMRRDAGGDCLAQPVSARTAGDFTALAETEGVVEIPAGLACEAGQPLRLYRW